MFRYFFWITLFLILSAGVFIFTITQIDPIGPQKTLAISLFFISLFGTVWTVMSYLFFFGAELNVGKNLSNENFQHALRQGFLVAFFVTALVTLRLFNLLGWIEGILLAIFLFLVELIFSMDSEILPSK
jgi:hypothetical protein